MKYKCTREILNIWVRINGIFNDNKHVLYKMGNSKSETESMKIKKLKMIVIHVQM